MTQFSIRMCLVLIVASLCGSSARAEYLDWSYRWSISPSPVLSSGTGSVAQALYPAGKGQPRILAAAVTTTSEATAQHPDVYNKSFSLTLHMTDLATHRTGNLTFYGTIRGTLSYNSAHLYESFRTTLEHLVLGRHIYWVRLPSYVRLMAPGSLVVPTYYASVLVENIYPPPPIVHPVVSTASITTASIASDARIASATPEPSGLVLGSLGAVLLGCFTFWRIWG